MDGYGDFATARAGHLYRSACLLTAGDTHLFEVLVQEILGRVYVRWGRVSRADDPAGYAQTVLARAFLAHQRRRSSTERSTAVFPELPASGADDPSLRLTLLDALARLPAKDGREKGAEGVVPWTVDTLRTDGGRVVISALNSGTQHENATRATPALTMEELRAVALTPEWDALL